MVAVRAVQVHMLELRGRGQHEIGVVDGIRGEELVDDREEVVAEQAVETFCWLGATAAGLLL